jgi:DNA-binding CsgD family transcriptional regulator
MKPQLLTALARSEAKQRAASALDHYGEALELLDEPRARADLLLELGHAQIAAGKWSEAAETFEAGLGALGAARDELYSRLEAGFVSAAWVSMTKRSEAERRFDAILASGSLDPAQRELVTWVGYQQAMSVSASAAEVRPLLNRAIQGAPMADLVNAGQLVEVAAGVLLPMDLEADIRFLTDAIAEVQRTPAHPKLGVYSYCRAWPNYYGGRLADAMADSQAALDAAEQGWETFFPATCAVLAQVQVERGELDEAERTIDIGEEWAQRIDYGILIPIARGRIALARGDAAAAAEQFSASAAVCEAMGVRGPVMSEWRHWKAVALARLGERDEARRLAGEAVDLAQRWGARWPLGMTLRALGLAEGGARGLQILEQAVTVLENSPARLELARATVHFGAALRRAGNLTRARSELARGSDLAHRIGAFYLIDLAREELLAAGARPRRYALAGPDALTPSELRVARMAAAGGTNRELAQALFVTPKAVEYHLANVYRKLGIASRRELPAALAESPSQSVA